MTENNDSDPDADIKLFCSCGWSSNVNKKYMAAVSDRHLTLNSEKGNIK
jgi:hypothetical protein